MWWALIEEIAPRAEEMACEKELVVLEAITYTRIHRQQQLGKCLCVAGSQPMLQIFQCKIIFVYENIFTTTTKKTKTNYITQAVSEIQPSYSYTNTCV